MIPFIFACLDILFLTWGFWVIVPGVLLWSAFEVLDDDKFEFFPHAFLALAVTATVYRYPLLFAMGWAFWVKVAIGYYLVGFTIALYKWIMVIWDFRRNKGLHADAKTQWDENTKGTQFKIKSLYFDVDKLIIKATNANGPLPATLNYYPNWKSYPIAGWWIHWPFFTLQVIFDPIKRFIDWSFDMMKDFFNLIAKWFSVKL